MSSSTEQSTDSDTSFTSSGAFYAIVVVTSLLVLSGLFLIFRNRTGNYSGLCGLLPPRCRRK
ncbi:hypothetical protein B9479_005673 [Cryptococcus floricola]|uniref:Uncharacterized protein n=1 Tax=Cryptococcus floricola TaxID=2591691 RepID=A0A5D3AV71_9TREE|nr:hypothetical protein B9479_005673 [Cryptococcus floricola]